MTFKDEESIDLAKDVKNPFQQLPLQEFQYPLPEFSKKSTENKESNEILPSLVPVGTLQDIGEFDENQEKAKFLNEKSILGEEIYVFWTDLCKYYPEREEIISNQQKQLARQTKCPNSLVIELIGTFLQLIDPESPDLTINDQSIKQLKCEINGQVCIVLIKFWPMGLLAQLKKLTKYYELVVYTILPRDVVNQFYKLVPGIEDFISHSLCYEDLVFSESEGLTYKDLALLAHNRQSHHVDENDGPSEIMVIDTKIGEECSDAQYVTFF